MYQYFIYIYYYIYIIFIYYNPFVTQINRKVSKDYNKLNNNAELLCMLWRPNRKRFRAAHTDKSTTKQSPTSAISPLHIYIYCQN